MASIADQTDQTGQADINAPKAVGGTSTGGAGFATGTGQGTSKAAPGGYGGVAPGSQSGSFQNVGAILDANKNSNIAGGIVNNYQNQAGQFNQGVGAQQQSADSAINNQWNTATGGSGGTAQQAQQNVQGIVQNAGTAQAGANDNSVFGAALNTQYQAPSVDWTNQQQQAQAFQQAGQNTQSAQGQTALLQQQYGRPSYTQGEQSIDQLLLQNNKQEQRNLGQLNTIAGQASNNLTNAQNNVTNTGATVQGNIQGLNQAAASALGGAIGTQDVNATDNTAGKYGTGILGTLGQQAAQEAANAQTAYSKVQSDITSQNLNPYLSAMGLTSGQNTFGLLNNQAGYNTLASDLQGPSAAQLTPGLSGTMTADQASRVNALNNLAGNSGLSASLQSALNLGNGPAQAGTVQAYNPTFNQDAIKNTLQQQQSAFQTAENPLLSELSSRLGATQALTGANSNDLNSIANNDPSLGATLNNVIAGGGGNISSLQGLLGQLNQNNLYTTYGQSSLNNPVAQQISAAGAINNTFGSTNNPTGALQDLLSTYGGTFGGNPVKAVPTAG